MWGWSGAGRDDRFRQEVGPVRVSPRRYVAVLIAGTADGRRRIRRTHHSRGAHDGPLVAEWFAFANFSSTER